MRDRKNHQMSRLANEKEAILTLFKTLSLHFEIRGYHEDGGICLSQEDETLEKIAANQRRLKAAAI